MSDPLAARRRTALVLDRVLRHGGFSNVILSTPGQGLASGDAERVKALTYGSLRKLPDLDREIEEASGRSLDELDPEVLDRLRVMAYEIRYGDTPDPVAVSVGVDLVREVKPRAAGMANAVLRRVAESDAPKQPGMSLPAWLEKSLSRVWSDDQIAEFSEASAQAPDRIGRLRFDEPEGGMPVEGIANAFTLPDGPVASNYVVQDSASIAVGNTVEAQPGEVVLDMAAAPGGKTLHLVDQVGDTGLVVASDAHRRRVVSGSKRVEAARWVVCDGSRPSFRDGTFDRILIDAPCSGFGTLRRRPEIALRVSENDADEMASLQRQMIEAAIPLLRAGGVLVYSVCTVTPQETIDVVDGLGFVPPDIPGEDLGDGRLMAPHITGTDGMFVAVRL